MSVKLSSMAVLLPPKRGSKVGKTKRGKGTKIIAMADSHGLPVSVSVESATPHEVKLAESTLLQMLIPEAPQNLIGDNAYDSDKLDTRLRNYGIELISPHHSNRKNRTQDRRRPRRYRRRWKMKDCSPGCRTFVGWSSVTNDTLRTFSGCSISRAA